MSVLFLADAAGGNRLPDLNPLELDECGAGQPVSTAVGRHIRVTLPENLSTGFKWTVDTACVAPVLHLDQDEPLPSNGDVPGAPGTHVWVFSATARGHCTLIFTSGRTFEQTPTGKSLSYPVTVHREPAPTRAR